MEKATEHGDYAYDYDDIYRLIDVDNPTLDDEAFAYDPVGNRLTAEGVAGTSTYNVNNELLSYDDVFYVYDENGNMTQKTAIGVVTKFFYNTEDRLERVEEGDGTLIAVYYYDPFGRRLWKEVSGSRTYFLYADEGLVGEYDASGAEIKTYGYKPGSTWTTDPLFMKQGSNYYFYHNDHLGSPQKMTAINGAVVWCAKYESFGEASVDAASTITNPFRFPGQYEDQETELHYNYHRYYEPRIGRYLTPDPSHHLNPNMPFLAFSFLTNPPDFHKYIYCRSNTIKHIDSKGLVCGSKKSDKYINDKPGGCDFTLACEFHDACYRTTITHPCPIPKSKCDREFFKIMLITNPKLKCVKYALLYYTAVAFAGGGAYGSP